MAPVVAETRAMIARLAPKLQLGRYEYRSLDPSAPVPADALGTFREMEGMSVIVPASSTTEAAYSWITLTVNSSLDGVGLTAAVSHALAEKSIPCNVVAAIRHDHLFVPENCAKKAILILEDLAKTTRPPL